MVGQMVGQKLAGRYRLLEQLGQGGFGQAYLAEDEHLPDQYQCVVKRFHMGDTQQEDTLRTAKRLFDAEAKALHRLGHHEQLPKLLAHFEDEGEFYLVEEYIPGHSLEDELQHGIPLSEPEVKTLLQDLLNVLSFVHQQQVIHRDIKPSNIIRRASDQRLVLIDFGAVKQVTTQMMETARPHTVVIGTPGYMPSEQFRGNPKPSSDVYAVGMIGIQALTGLNPSMGELPEDDLTGDIQWRDRAQVSHALAEILSKMVRYDFRQRYPSAQDALMDLTPLLIPPTQILKPSTAEPLPIEVPPVWSETLSNGMQAEAPAADDFKTTVQPKASDLPEPLLATVVSERSVPIPDAPLAEQEASTFSSEPETAFNTLVSSPAEAKPFKAARSSRIGGRTLAILGGGAVLALSGLFLALGAPHVESICGPLGNCTASVKARSSYVEALSSLEGSQAQLTAAKSLTDLEALRAQMKTALETIRSLSSNNTLAVSSKAQSSAAQFQPQYDQLTQRIAQERSAEKTLKSAVATASKALNTKAETVAAKESNRVLWENAVDLLAKVPKPSFVYEQAQTKKKDYEAHIQQINQSIDEIMAEERARQQQAAAAPAYSPSQAEPPSSGENYSPPQESASAYQEPVYQEPAPAYQEPAPAYQEPAPAYQEPAPAPSNSEPLWGGSNDPQSEPLW